MTLRRLVSRLLALVSKDRLDRELDGEVQAHLELAERDALARGLDPADARAAALRAFGGVEQMKEVHRDDRSPAGSRTSPRTRATASRRSGGIRDSRSSPSACWRSASAPTPPCSASSTRVLLKPLPFPNPERIVRVWETPTPTTTNSTTALNFVEELKRRSSHIRSVVGGVD